MTKPSTRNRVIRSKTSSEISNELDAPMWLWGSHAVESALRNSNRPRLAFLATENAARRLQESFSDAPTPEIVPAKALEQSLPSGAVHQGLALKTKYLSSQTLEDAITSGDRRIVVLDQLTDPHNLGAIMRSAVAFGFDACVMQNRHTPALNGTVAKAAVGAVDLIREVRVVNIARALNELDKRGYTVIGLAGNTDASLDALVRDVDKLVLVLGAEGTGLRPVVAGACHSLVKIPMSDSIESLNVSNAAAIAFYEATRASF